MAGLGAGIVLVWDSLWLSPPRCVSLCSGLPSLTPLRQSRPINCDSSLGHTKGLVPWGLETLTCYPPSRTPEGQESSPVSICKRESRPQVAWKQSAQQFQTRGRCVQAVCCAPLLPGLEGCKRAQAQKCSRVRRALLYPASPLPSEERSLSHLCQLHMVGFNVCIT